MNLAGVIEIYAGGVGSGPNCEEMPNAGNCGRRKDASDWEKVGGQKGSNQGGTYKDPSTGEKYYVKNYPLQERVHAEVLANTIYDAAGLKAPDGFFVSMGGKTAYASKWEDGASPMSRQDITKSSDFSKGFAVDAWLANHDVVGLTYDNVVKVGSRAVRVDNGGAMFYRAQGAPKSFFTQHPNDVPELDSMRNPHIAREAGRVFEGLSTDDVKSQVNHLVHTFTDDKIDGLVKHAGFAGAEAKKYSDILKSRRDGMSAWAKKH